MSRDSGNGFTRSVRKPDALVARESNPEYRTQEKSFSVPRERTAGKRPVCRSLIARHAQITELGKCEQTQCRNELSVELAPFVARMQDKSAILGDSCVV